ncbi:MAG: ABC transporter substrate-binding protein [Polyangiales bacterium]
MAPPSPEPAARPTLKLGQIMPYTGPASTYGNIGRLHAAYFEMVNEKGGVGGRAIDLVSLDDGYSPVRALAQVRTLVEIERVAAIFSPVGTPSNVAIQPYLHDVAVPQLFVSSGASRWDDPTHFPLTLGFNPSYRLEGKTYAGHILAEAPSAKIAVLYQDDDFGKDLLAGFREGLGPAAAKQLVATARYATSEIRIDHHVEALRQSGADTLVLITTPRFGIQAIRRADALDWKPTRYIANVSASIGTVLTQAGLERSEGLLTTQYLKDPTDKRWQDDPGMLAWRAFMRDHYPQGDTRDGLNVYAYVAAETLLHVLNRCEGDFSATNLMAQATALRDFAPGLLLPGVKINTSPTDYEPFDTLQLSRFDGVTWQLLDQETALLGTPAGAVSRPTPGRARETARR